jgi:glutathionylspermidine synthase
MKRLRLQPRPDWQAKAEAVGFTYHSRGAAPGESEVYWDESVAWEFTAEEVDTLEAATAELHRISLAAADHVAANPPLMEHFRIPPEYRGWVAASRQRRDPHVYGRFDLAFEPEAGPPKLLEYNADTPTTLLESAVVQWFWLEDVFPDADQFNSIHEKLVERWRTIGKLMPPDALLHLSSDRESLEEHQTVEYLCDTVEQAGIPHRHVAIADIGWDEARGMFVDPFGEPIRFWFKLYPWEWLLRDEFAPHLLADRTGIIEPPWKMLLSNKALLPLLWELFPGHPNLLPASFDRAALGDGDVIAKPILAREGANLALTRRGAAPVVTEGPYGDEPVVYQQVAKLAERDGVYAVFGSWVIGDDPAGICVREDTSPIVTGDSRVVPHLFR